MSMPNCIVMHSAVQKVKEGHTPKRRGVLISVS